jgi:hypothetical protein
MVLLGYGFATMLLIIIIIVFYLLYLKKRILFSKVRRFATKMTSLNQTVFNSTTLRENVTQPAPTTSSYKQFIRRDMKIRTY